MSAAAATAVRISRRVAAPAGEMVATKVELSGLKQHLRRRF